MRKVWLEEIIKKITPKTMSKATESTKNNPNVKATKSGKLIIDETSFFKSEKVKAIIEKLLKSSIHKELKGNVQ